MSNKPFIALKIIDKEGKTIKMIASHKIKRVYHILQAAKFKDCTFYIKVQYSKDNFNDGEYQTISSLIKALKFFTQKNLVTDFL